MGLEIGFEFYQKTDCDFENKTVKVKRISIEDIMKKLNNEDINWLALNSCENVLFICGRNLVNNSITELIDGFGGYCVLNQKLNDYKMVLQDSITNLISIDIKSIEKVINFDELQNCYEKDIANYENQIEELFSEIEILRVHQEVARTQIAFDGFQKQIDMLKDRINDIDGLIEEYTNGDSDFAIAALWKNYIDTVKIIMNSCEDIVVTIYVSY